jgi:toxin CptA
MHNAPSVSYPVGRSLVAGALAAAAWLLGALACVQWTVQSQVSGWRLGAAGIALAAAALVSARNWQAMPRGILGWDGQSWTWTGAGKTDIGTVEVCLDVQQCLLVHFRGRAVSHWLWLERAHCAERWDDLRRAVYSRARPQTLPKAEPGAAEP